MEKFSIIGISHEGVKLAAALAANKKVTGADNLFITEGLWAFDKLIKYRVKVQAFLFCLEFIKTPEDEAAVAKLIDYADKAYSISKKSCNRISEREGADGFFCICEFTDFNIDSIKLNENNVIVILDGLEQPGNIGSIIRSADAAGAAGVIICNRRVRLTHSRLIRSSLGAVFAMPVVTLEIDELIEWLKSNGFEIYLTDLNATQNYYEPDYSGRVAIVGGNEFLGVSKTWYEHKCSSIIIPMFGSCESLNVGLATSMVVYEASLKQKGLK